MVVRACLANRLLAVTEFTNHMVENHVYPSQLEATIATVSKIDAKLDKVTQKRDWAAEQVLEPSSLRLQTSPRKASHADISLRLRSQKKDCLCPSSCTLGSRSVLGLFPSGLANLRCLYLSSPTTWNDVPPPLSFRVAFHGRLRTPQDLTLLVPCSCVLLCLLPKRRPDYFQNAGRLLPKRQPDDIQ